MTKHVVTGFDSSETSRQAVNWAADQASRRGCRLKIVACSSVPVGTEMSLGWSGAEAYALVQQATESGVEELRAQVAERYPELEIVTECHPGSPALSLVDKTTADDLIVVGASRHHDAAAFWLGSTARAVVRTAPCAVAVIRGNWPDSRPARIVVGVDGSEQAELALRWAAAQAELDEVPLRLVHVWDYPYVKPDFDATLATPDPDMLPARQLIQLQASELMEIDAAKVLEEAGRHARQLTTRPIDTRLVRGGPVPSLLASVEDDELLVVGSRGRGAVMAGLFGSVANAVLDHATTPTVVVAHH